MTGHTDEAIFARNSRGEGHSTIKSLAETKDLLEARSVTMGICPKKSAATPRSEMEWEGEEEEEEEEEEEVAVEKEEEASLISTPHLYLDKDSSDE